MEKTKVRESTGFACAECREDIDVCDKCGGKFDYIGEVMYCDGLSHFCRECNKTEVKGNSSQH